ncbi:MAG TPA: hypothetical protein VGL77_06000 [Armatimonadota bacterium]|jgi:hypothetical protein
MGGATVDDGQIPTPANTPLVPPTPLTVLLPATEEDLHTLAADVAARVGPPTRWSRLALYGLVPLALLLALIAITVCGIRNWRINELKKPLLGQDPKTETAIESEVAQLTYAYPPTATAKRRAVHFMLRGDMSRSTYAERHRALWEAHPQSRVFYAHFALATLYDLDARNPAQRRHAEEVIRRGSQLDPDNGLYHYLLANIEATAAIQNYDDFVKSKPGEPKLSSEERYTRTFARYRILDHTLFDSAIAELRRGTQARYCTGYHVDLINERLHCLPVPDHYEDQLTRFNIAEIELSPELSRFRSLALNLTFFAKQLHNEGRTDEAIEVIGAWQPFSRQTLQTADSLIKAQVALMIAEIGTDRSPAIYAQLGLSQHAAHDHALYLRLKAARQRLNRERSDPAEEKYVQEHSHPIFLYLSPVMGTLYTHNELTPLRQLGYALAHQYILAPFLALLATVLILQLIIGWRWALALRRRGISLPLLTLPPGTLLGIVAVTVLLPLAVYALYSLRPALSGRDLSVYVDGGLRPRFLLEMLGLSLLLIICPVKWAICKLHDRCQMVGIPLPTSGKAMRIFAGLARGVWVAFFFVSFLSIPLSIVKPWWQNARFPWGALAIMLVYMAILITMRVQPGLRKAPTADSLYYGVMARGLAPVYALMLVLLAGGVMPLLDYQERLCIRQDRLMFYQGEMRGFLPIEDRAINRLREAIMPIIDEKP